MSKDRDVERQREIHNRYYKCSADVPQMRGERPSRASISRKRCPLPIPPKDGLHDISPAKDRMPRQESRDMNKRKGNRERHKCEMGE